MSSSSKIDFSGVKIERGPPRAKGGGLVDRTSELGVTAIGKKARDAARVLDTPRKKGKGRKCRSQSKTPPGTSVRRSPASSETGHSPRGFGSSRKIDFEVAEAPHLSLAERLSASKCSRTPIRADDEGLSELISSFDPKTSSREDCIAAIKLARSQPAIFKPLLNKYSVDDVFNYGGGAIDALARDVEFSEGDIDVLIAKSKADNDTYIALASSIGDRASPSFVTKYIENCPFSRLPREGKKAFLRALLARYGERLLSQNLYTMLQMSDKIKDRDGEDIERSIVERFEVVGECSLTMVERADVLLRAKKIIGITREIAKEAQMAIGRLAIAMSQGITITGEEVLAETARYASLTSRGEERELNELADSLHEIVDFCQRARVTPLRVADKALVFLSRVECDEVCEPSFLIRQLPNTKVINLAFAAASYRANCIADGREETTLPAIKESWKSVVFLSVGALMKREYNERALLIKTPKEFDRVMRAAASIPLRVQLDELNRRYQTSGLIKRKEPEPSPSALAAVRYLTCYSVPGKIVMEHPLGHRFAYHKVDLVFEGTSDTKPVSVEIDGPTHFTLLPDGTRTTDSSTNMRNIILSHHKNDLVKDDLESHPMGDFSRLLTSVREAQGKK